MRADLRAATQLDDRGGVQRAPPLAAVSSFTGTRGPQPDRPDSHRGRGAAGGGSGLHATVALDRDQARALIAAADAQALRTAAVVRLLLHDALRVDEASAADVTDLAEDSGRLAPR